MNGFPNALSTPENRVIHYTMEKPMYSAKERFKPLYGLAKRKSNAIPFYAVFGFSATFSPNVEPFGRSLFIITTFRT